MCEEKDLKGIIEEARLKINLKDHKAAAQKLFQALRVASQISNEKLLNKIFGMFAEIGYLFISTQSVEVDPIKTEGFILDIGGGGEGVIGRLNGKQVVAVDINERELEETDNKALKVVMDATDLKFLPKSFDVCTAFFSLMYIPKEKHLKVFEETHRVLKESGRFMIWDVRIPREGEKYSQFVMPLKVHLPDEERETGYGVKYQKQDIIHFKEIAKKVKFEITNEWSKGEIFYLEMIKKK